VADRALTLAAQCGVRLPSDLRVWALAGEARSPSVARSGRATATPSEAAWALVRAMEGALSVEERQRGAHYTPEAVAEHVAALALPRGAPAGPVVDPACGAGALLLAAADRVAATGQDRAAVARQLLFGADIDPLAVAVAEAALALWSGGVPPARGHLIAGDPLGCGRSLWPAPPEGGFGAVVGNPPFQGQLTKATARSADEAGRLRRRFGGVVGPYVDTAALFLLVGLDLAAPGARIAMVQPQSTAAARDAGPVRAALAERARLVDLWAPPERLFAARVHVCVPVLEVGEGDGRADWSAEVAAARGTPRADLGRAARLGRSREHLRDRARVLGSFRDHYYGLVPHVTEADVPPPMPPLVTSGLLGIGHCAWGEQPVRFAKRWWDQPVVDVEAVRAGSRRLDGWLGAVLAPKLVVASQTKVLEAAADAHGRWVPSTPTVSVVPTDPGDLGRLLAAVCSPVASAWAASRAAGTALSADTFRVTRALLEALPLPLEAAAWDEAERAMAAGDLEAYGEAATAMYGLGRHEAIEVLDWWRPRARSAWCPDGALR